MTLAVGILLMIAGAVEASVAQSQQISNAQDTVAMQTVRLRGLDTLNGTAKDLTMKVGATLQYGHLEIVADTCRVPQAEPESDAYAFLRIRDLREEAPRFSGWMFASSPALSALDHPRYDVWVVSCTNN